MVWGQPPGKFDNHLTDINSRHACTTTVVTRHAKVEEHHNGLLNPHSEYSLPSCTNPLTQKYESSGEESLVLFLGELCMGYFKTNFCLYI